MAGSTAGPGATDGADGLAALTATVDKMEALDFDGLPHAVQVEWLLKLRRLLDLLEVQWLRELAAVDARGATGAATSSVRTARALIPPSQFAGWVRGLATVRPLHCAFRAERVRIRTMPPPA